MSYFLLLRDSRLLLNIATYCKNKKKIIRVFNNSKQVHKVAEHPRCSSLTIRLSPSTALRDSSQHKLYCRAATSHSITRQHHLLCTSCDLSLSICSTWKTLPPLDKKQRLERRKDPVHGFTLGRVSGIRTADPALRDSCNQAALS